MSADLRCFVAAEISEKVRNRLEREIGFLQLGGGNVRWVPKNNMHITLRFIGDADPNDMVAICRVIDEATEDIVPCLVEIDGIITFPDSARPRVIAAGVKGDVEPLKKLFNNLQQGLAPLGYRPEKKGLVPHVTLGRMKGGDTDDLLARVKESAWRAYGTSTIDKIQLFMSVPGPKGPEFTVMKTFRL